MFKSTLFLEELERDKATHGRRKVEQIHRTKYLLLSALSGSMISPPLPYIYLLVKNAMIDEILSSIKENIKKSSKNKVSSS